MISESFYRVWIDLPAFQQRPLEIGSIPQLQARLIDASSALPSMSDMMKLRRSIGERKQWHAMGRVRLFLLIDPTAMLAHVDAPQTIAREPAGHQRQIGSLLSCVEHCLALC